MFVNNYKTIRKFLKLGCYNPSGNINYSSILNKLGRITNPSGIQYDSIYLLYNDYGTRAVMDNFSANIFVKGNGNRGYGLNTKNDLSYYDGMYMALGNGTGELNENDYDLFTHLNYGEDYTGILTGDTIASSLNEDGTINQITIMFSFKALKDITITEIGLTHVININWSTSSHKCHPILLSHELLDEPMTFTEGELFSITYTVEIPIE